MELRGHRPGLRVVAVVGVAVAVALSVGLAWSIARAAARSRFAAPQLRSLRYGRFRPQGSPHAYFALKLSAWEREGQVVETDFNELPSGFSADGLSRCGIGGRKSGRVETFYMPVMPRLTRGVHRIHVTAVGSSCNRKRASATASRTFTVTVR